MAIIKMQPGDRYLPCPGIYQLAEDAADIHICLIGLTDMMRRYFPSVSVTHYQTLPGQELTPDAGRVDFLNRSDISQLNGFKSLKKQVEWIGGRYALKTLAVAVLPGAGRPEQVGVACEARGASYLVDRAEISVSISHAGDYAAAGICLAAGKRMGLDIESMTGNGLEDVKRVAFTEREAAAAGDSREQAFRIWTRKEAYLKFIKSGFGESLKRVDVSGTDIRHGGLPVNGLSIQTLKLAEHYLLSVVNHR